MQQDTFLCREPSRYILGTISLTTCLKQPRGSSATTQLMTNRVVGTEELLTAQTCDVVETAYKVRRQGQQFSHLANFLRFLYSRKMVPSKVRISRTIAT